MLLSLGRNHKCKETKTHKTQLTEARARRLAAMEDVALLVCGVPFLDTERTPVVWGLSELAGHLPSLVCPPTQTQIKASRANVAISSQLRRHQSLVIRTKG